MKAADNSCEIDRRWRLISDCGVTAAVHGGGRRLLDDGGDNRRSASGVVLLEYAHWCAGGCTLDQRSSDVPISVVLNSSPLVPVTTCQEFQHRFVGHSFRRISAFCDNCW